MQPNQESTSCPSLAGQTPALRCGEFVRRSVVQRVNDLLLIRNATGVSAEEICNVVGDLVRIGELAIAAQKSTDAYCNESTIQPSEEDWRIDGTEEHKLWNAMESDIAELRAAIDAHLSSPNKQVSRGAQPTPDSQHL